MATKKKAAKKKAARKGGSRKPPRRGLPQVTAFYELGRRGEADPDSDESEDLGPIAKGK